MEGKGVPGPKPSSVRARGFVFSASLARVLILQASLVCSCVLLTSVTPLFGFQGPPASSPVPLLS